MANDVATVARRWFEEIWNQRRTETIDELLLPERVCHADDGDIVGPVEFRERIYVPLNAAFPGIRLAVEGVIVEDSRAAVRWTATGTHTGDGPGFAPTGKAAAFRGLTWLHIDGDKLIAGWQCSNLADAIRSLFESAAGSVAGAGPDPSLAFRGI